MGRDGEEFYEWPMNIYLSHSDKLSDSIVSGSIQKTIMSINTTDNTQ
jgi:hypothetical protein